MIFLNFEKQIKGESDVEGYKDWIRADSVQLGVGRGISTIGGGGDRETSAPSFSEITLTKATDLSSADLFMQATCGESLGKADLHIVNVRDKKVEPYLKIELHDAIISSYSASSGGDRPSESFSINFTKITYQYDKWDGGTKITGTAKKYDLKKNAKFA